ncbi:Mediator of RNA polymerase II transcription subunit 6 [Savitreella phatthalungensis]
MASTDLRHIVWRAPEIIKAFGQLRTDNVLEYFSFSPFYDRRSNNSALKMQSQFQNFGDATLALTRMRGLEFAVASEQPPDLWIISKRYRESPSEVRPIASYIVLNANIYLAPDTANILSTRLLNINHALADLTTLLHDNVYYDPDSGHRFKEAADKTARLSSGQLAMHKALESALANP